MKTLILLIVLVTIFSCNKENIEVEKKSTIKENVKVDSTFEIVINKLKYTYPVWVGSINNNYTKEQKLLKIDTTKRNIEVFRFNFDERLEINLYTTEKCTCAVQVYLVINNIRKGLLCKEIFISEYNIHFKIIKMNPYFCKL